MIPYSSSILLSITILQHRDYERPGLIQGYFKHNEILAREIQLKTIEEYLDGESLLNVANFR